MTGVTACSHQREAVACTERSSTKLKMLQLWCPHRKKLMFRWEGRSSRERGHAVYALPSAPLGLFVTRSPFPLRFDR
jgi:hypothetical protein